MLDLWLHESDAISYLLGTFKMNPLVFNSWTFSFYLDPVESHTVAVSEENDSYSPKFASESEASLFCPSS